MSKIRETVITNCEKKFLNKCLTEHTRLDGRAFNEFRPIEIQFGKDWGCCYVSLGKTRILAQTSCEIQEPKSSRPSEGILNINCELNPLAAPQFEAGRQSDLSVQLNRLLEKCIKDSKAVDLESLCIRTSEKVWSLKVDINVLNHEGNILDCASIAMLASLAHFRRPDVTCDGEEFIIHDPKKRDPIPTVIHHYPTCITYSIFNGGDFLLADPTLLEEGVADATLSIGLNGFRELCGFHLGGKAELSPNVILNTATKASERAKIVIEQIKSAVKVNNELRQKQEAYGFHINIDFRNVTSVDLSNILDQWQESNTKRKKNQKKKLEPKKLETEEKVEVLGKGSAAYVPQEENKSVWEVEKSSEESDDEIAVVEQKEEEPIQVDTDSEEDDVMILDGGGEFKSLK